MANKRMFSKEIVENDIFLDMPLSAQALYFHLCMEADDEGFVGNPKKVIRSIRANDDDFNILITKKFAYVLEKGIAVVIHWKVNNSIRKDRIKETMYISCKKQLKEVNGIYYLKDDKTAISYRKGRKKLSTNCQPNDNQMSPQYSEDECSVGEDSVGKDVVVRELVDKAIKDRYGNSDYEYEDDQEKEKFISFIESLKIIKPEAFHDFTCLSLSTIFDLLSEYKNMNSGYEKYKNVYNPEGIIVDKITAIVKEFRNENSY